MTDKKLTPRVGDRVLDLPEQYGARRERNPRWHDTAYPESCPTSGRSTSTGSIGTGWSVDAGISPSWIGSRSNGPKDGALQPSPANTESPSFSTTSAGRGLLYFKRGQLEHQITDRI